MVKIVDINEDLIKLLNSAIQNDRLAQRKLYDRYAARVLSVCRQYIDDIFQAEDVMISTFMKVFTYLHTFENKGNFDAWLRKIAVNESISFLRSKKIIVFQEEQYLVKNESQPDSSYYLMDDYQNMIDALPEGCKLIFVMFAIDGYKHHEIARILQISEGTSKSQLAYARKLLQYMIAKENKSCNG